jgi:amphi-Trp domain-containing protein
MILKPDTQADKGETTMGHHRSHREQRELHEHGAGSGHRPVRTVRSRACLEVEQAAGYLESLAEALRAGGVTIRSGTSLAALSVGNSVELKLEAGEEARHSVVHLELRWETPVPDEHLEIVAGIDDPRTAEAPPATGADDSSAK